MQHAARPAAGLPWLLLLVLAATAARLVYHLEIRDYVLCRVPLVDAQEYVEWARNLARGGSEIQDAYYKAPFYPHFLSWWMRLLGPGLGTAYLVNGLLGVVNVLLLWAWGRRVVGQRLAWCAAGCAAIYGPFLYYEMQPMPTALAMSLALASLVLLSGGERPPGKVRSVLAGAALGALVLTRPSFLVWLGAAAVWTLGRAPRRRAGHALLLVASALACIAPVTWRNRVRSGEWVLVSANAGINFFLGNNPQAERTATLRPGLQWEELVVSPPETERRGQPRWDRWFGTRGLVWVKSRPLDFCAGLGRKSLQYLSAYPIDRNLDVRGFRRESALLRRAPDYAWLAPWIPLGLVVGWRRRGPARLGVLFWLANAVATVLFFVTERYRIDAVPAGLVLATLALATIAAQVRRKDSVVGARTAGLLVAGGLILAYGDFGDIRHLHPARASALEGAAHYTEGRYVSAIACLQAALAEDSTDADAHYQLGSAFLKQNRRSEALAEYERAHALAPRSPKPLVNAGWVRRDLGQREAALAHYEQASALAPTDPALHFEIGLQLEELGRPQPARARFERVLQLGAEPEMQAAARQRLVALGLPPAAAGPQPPAESAPP